MSVIHHIQLHGRLKTFGESFNLSVATPAEAIRALSLQISGFGETMMDGSYRLVRGPNPNDGVDYGLEAIHFPIGAASRDFHIVPVVAGAGRGVGKIVLGVALMVGSVLTAGAPWAASFSAAMGTKIGVGTITYGGIFGFGAAMTLGGVAQMLSPTIKPNYQQAERPEQRASFFLGGQVNQASQGGPVILTYGRCRVGSTVVSAGLTAEQML